MVHWEYQPNSSQLRSFIQDSSAAHPRRAGMILISSVSPRSTGPNNYYKDKFLQIIQGCFINLNPTKVGQYILLRDIKQIIVVTQFWIVLFMILSWYFDLFKNNWPLWGCHAVHGIHLSNFRKILLRNRITLLWWHWP